jgi:cytochrome c biogenesis protein CcdA
MSHRSPAPGTILAILAVFLLIAGLQVSLACASAAGDSTHVAYVYSRDCLSCQHAGPALQKAFQESPRPVRLSCYELNTREGAEYATRRGIVSVPAVIVDNGTPLLMENYSDLPAFYRAVREELNAASLPSPLEVSRSVSRVAGSSSPGAVTTDTCISCRSTVPLNVSVTGGLPDGAALMSGEPGWSGVLQPGESRHITCSFRVPAGVKSLPPQTISYDDSHGVRMIRGPEVALLAQKLSALSAFMAGLVAGFNPCLLAVMAFIAGTTISATHRRLDILARIAAFCGGLVAIYMLVGVGLLELMARVPSLEAQMKLGVVMALSGFAAWTLLDAYRTGRGGESKSFRAVVRRIEPLYRTLGVPASFVMGAAFGMVKMPCVGGMYIAILGSILEAGLALEGVICLASYNLGIVAPVLALGVLLTIGLSPAKVTAFRLKHRVKLKAFTGLLLAAMAAAFAIGAI